MPRGFPGGADDKESAGNTGDLGSIPRLGRSSGEGNGNPLQYSCLENSMDRGAWGGYSPWDCKESDTTGQLTLSPQCHSDFSFSFFGHTTHHTGSQFPMSFPGIKLMPPALGAWSLKHWTAREVPFWLFLTAAYLCFLFSILLFLLKYFLYLF